MSPCLQIHRDIKPENILKMSDDMSIKLVDFGVSEMFSKEEEQRELRTGGSPAFMAPELCMSGHTKVSGKAADIWALGKWKQSANTNVAV